MGHRLNPCGLWSDWKSVRTNSYKHRACSTKDTAFLFPVALLNPSLIFCRKFAVWAFFFSKTNKSNRDSSEHFAAGLVLPWCWQSLVLQQCNRYTKKGWVTVPLEQVPFLCKRGERERETAGIRINRASLSCRKIKQVEKIWVCLEVQLAFLILETSCRPYTLTYLIKRFGKLGDGLATVRLNWHQHVCT